MNVRYRVELSQPERDELGALLNGGRHAVRKLKRAQILLAADAGAGDEVIAATLAVSGSTIYRTKRRFVEANLEGALSEDPRPGAMRKLSGKEEALLVATACSKPPPGRARWTLELLAGEVRAPIPAKPGQLERYDCEYRRNGTVNLFVFLDVHRPWRRVKVTDRRTNQDFAHCMRDLVDLHYPQAPVIRVVMDNLSTHSAGALYDAFPATEARRILKRLDFHHTPKHASWLNMVEIEIGVLRSQCLDRRIDDKALLVAEIAAWEQRRNAEKAQIKWMFTTEKAREKLRKAYPVKES